MVLSEGPTAKMENSMKKILVFMAVLALLAGTAYAADLNDGLTRQVWGQSKGRSVVSDGSVAMRVWYTGSANGAINVSTNSVNLYDDGALTAVDKGTYGTAEIMVDYISSLATWEAALGPDAIPGTVIGGPTNLAVLTNAAAGTSKSSPSYVSLDSGSSRRLSAGIEGTEGKFNRIKSITSKYASAAPGTITVLVYDGDNLMWRKDVNTTPYNTATSKDASPDTVTFMNATDKGIAGSLGKSLVAVVSTDTAVVISSPITADKVTDHNISIVYDQF